MALSTTTNKQSFTAVSGQTKFDFTIPYFDTTDISVVRIDTDGTYTTLSYNASPSSATQFSVTATNSDTANGATITLGGTATTGSTYIVERTVPYTQQYDLQEGSTIDPTALNKALDRVVAQNQQQNDLLTRTVEFPVTDGTSTTYTVGSETERASKALGFDALGNVTELDLSESGTVSGNTNAGIEVTSNQISAKIDTDSLEFNSGKINVKDSGIGTSEIANDAVTNAKIDASAVGTTEIADDAVTYAKIQDVSTDTVLGRLSAGTGAVESITVDEDISSVSASHDTLASALAVKNYVDSKGITQTSGTAPYYGIRAFARYQGTGTPTLLDSGNISSVTRNGVGDYTFTLTTAMPDANYVVNVSCSTETNVHHAVPFIESISAGSFRLKFFNESDSSQLADKSIVCATVVG